MNNLIYDIRMSKPYRFLRMILYYVFQKKKRDAEICNIESGKDTKYSYLRKYKDIHKGQRCFIVATGPSLTREQLELIKNEVTIGVNALCMKFDEMNWKTDYFVISDLKAYKKLRPVLHERNMEFFCAHKSENDDESCIFIPTDIQNAYMINFNKKVFRKNIELGCGSGNTVVIHAIQIAAYMGFSEIYLLGVDCNYSGKKMYFIDHGIRGREQFYAGRRMIADFESIKRYENEWGIKIFNASDGGMLEVFPRVNLEDIIKGK